MKFDVRYLVRLLLLSVIFTIVFAQQFRAQLAPVVDTARKIETKITNLPSALVYVARQYEFPIIIELAKPYPKRVIVPGGLVTARQALNGILRGQPEYEWKMNEGVAHVYQVPLNSHPKNFLNWKIREFAMPGNLANVPLKLRSLVGNIKAGIENGGGLATAAPQKELEAYELPNKTLHDMTIREILFAVARIQSVFYSVVVFPSDSPQSDAELDVALGNWTLNLL